MNAWSSEEAGGYEIFRLGAKPAASFHFKRLSILRCHLRRRRRTLERISDGAVMWEKGVTCSAWRTLQTLNEHISPQCQHSWTFQLFFLLHTGEHFFKQLLRTFARLEQKCEMFLWTDTQIFGTALFILLSTYLHGFLYIIFTDNLDQKHKKVSKILNNWNLTMNKKYLFKYKLVKKIKQCNKSFYNQMESIILRFPLI